MNRDNPFNPNRQKIRIVLGGSFNPPTVAHRALMEHAIYHVMMGTGQPVYGAYVPSSHEYVSRKMSKQKGLGNITYSEQDRLKMLEAACGSPLADILDIEYGDDGKGHTYRTLCKVRERYPDDRIMFLTGADKLKIIPRWRDAEKLLSEFTVLATCRNENEADAMIDADPFLKKYVWAFWTIPELPDKYRNVSSTMARAAVARKNRDHLSMLCGYETALLALKAAEIDALGGYKDLVSAIIKAGPDAVSDFIGRPASDIPESALLDEIQDTLAQMPMSVIQLFIDKYQK